MTKPIESGKEGRKKLTDFFSKKAQKNESLSVAVVESADSAVSDATPYIAVSPPFFLMVGSLTGITLKDAKLYADGLAEKFITSPRLARVHVQHDKPKNRIVYEIHEGGPGYSILDKLLKKLEEQRTVRIELANDAHVEMSDEFGELVTLHFPAGTHENLGGTIREDDNTPFVELKELCSNLKLPELFPLRKGYVVTGAVMMVLSAAILLASGMFFAVKKSGFLDSDPVTTMAKGVFPPSVEDNPYWHLQRAKQEALSKKDSLGKLVKTNGTWSWNLKRKPAVQPSSAPVPPTPTLDLKPGAESMAAVPPGERPTSVIKPEKKADK